MGIESAEATTPSNRAENGLPALKFDRLKITLTKSPSPLPPPEDMKVGKYHTDHLLMASFDPKTGWSEPEIKPYCPLVLDPACSVFQYATGVFEGLKAYVDPQGKLRLFRPNINIARFLKGIDRMGLPMFESDEFLALLKKFVTVEERWIPKMKGYNVYCRPTCIGTRPHIGLSVSEEAILYCLMTPMAPYLSKPLSLLAVNDHVRAWPGGTGSLKVSVNYAATFKPAREAEQRGHDQVLWMIDDRLAEAGAMNFIAIVQREDGDLDLVTPPLDGTILPGVTRQSCLELAAAHPSRTILPGVPATQRLHVQERTIHISDMFKWHEDGKLLEMMLTGTAVVVVGVSKLTFEDRTIALPTVEGTGGRGPVSYALHSRILDIQEGRYEWEDWSVLCE